MVSKYSQDANPGQLDEAIDWHIRLSAPDTDAATWEAFTLWLEADPANREAYDHIEELDAELEQPGLRDTFAAGEHASGLVRLGRAPVERRRIPISAWIAGAALAAAALIIAVMPHTSAPASVDFETQIGETKSVALSDGTQIDINTDTRIVVALDRSVRHVTLDHGEVLFRVAKDPVHPFIVTVGDRDVRVVGTVFDILYSDGTTTVTVAEGHVGVLPRSTSVQTKAIALSPGDQFVHKDGTSTSTVERINPGDALAWRQGYLIYRNAPLSKVVSDLGRYFAAPISLEDKTVASQRFSGVLRVDNESAILKRLSQFLPVTIEHQPGGRIALRMSDTSH
ncbi:MAG: FecR family protein [Rhizomicrobium sp.]